MASVASAARQRSRDELDHQFLAAIRAVAEEIAGPAADEVDRLARFPREALDRLRADRALSAYVPADQGGGGVSIDAVARGCFELGRRCGSTGLIFAMHQIQVITLVRHGHEARWPQDYLARLVADQRLIGSVTSEVGTGGDLGRSVAGLTTEADGSSRPDQRTLSKRAPTVSYGSYADDLMITARRSADAEPVDQVLVLVSRDQLTLTETTTWDPLGMRGTCSPGFVVEAAFDAEQILPDPFARIATQTMVPVSHLLWSHVWLGIAADAFDRARAFVRGQAKQSGHDAPAQTAQRLSHLMAELSLMRALVDARLREFSECSQAGAAGLEQLSTMAAVLRFNNLKTATSEHASRICQEALSICGVLGYLNNTPFSIGRHLRDALSASVMVANERIHHSNASLLLVAKDLW